MVGSKGVRAGKAFVELGVVDKTALVLNRVADRFKAVGAQITAMGRSMITKALAGLTPAALGVKVFATFDDSMRKVGARSRGTKSELEALRQQAKDLGRTTSFTASQVAELQAKLAQKGFDRSAIKGMTADVMNLARAAGEGAEQDTVLAADVISGSMRAFGAGADEAGRFADVFSAAVNNSNFSLDGLMSSMATAGPVASSFNVGLEETVATLAGMTNLNIDASTAGTAFRNMLLKLSNAAGRDNFNKQLQNMTGSTIDFVDEMGNLRSLPKLLFSIGNATKDLGSAQKGDLLNQLFGLRAIVPATALGEGENAFAGLRQVLEDSKGTAAATAAEMDAGIGGTFRKLWSAVEGLGIAIGEAVAGPLGQFTDWITTMIEPITQWISQNGELIAIIAGVLAGVAALGAAMMVTGVSVSLLGSALAGLAVAIKIVFALVTFLLSPISLLIAAIAGIVIAIEHFTGAITAGFQSATSFLASQFSWLIESTRKTMGGIMDAIKIGRFDLAFAVAWAGIKLVWAQGVQWVMNLLDKWVTAILNVVTRMHFAIAKIMTDMWDGLRLVWFAGTQGLKILMLTIMEFITQKIADFIGGLLKKVGSAAKKIPGAKKAGKSLVSAGESLENLAEGVSGMRQKAQREMEEGVARIGQENIDKNKALEEERDRIISGQASRNEERTAERQRRVDKAKEELEKALGEVDTATAEAEKEIDENAPEIKKPEAPESFQTDAPETRTAAVSSRLVKGLEKGTVEAMEQANKNAQNKVWNKMLDKQDEQIVAVNKVEDAVREKPGMQGV